MKTRKMIGAGLVGLALSCLGSIAPVNAQALRVMNGSSSATSSLSVPMNRAVVVESDVPFAELSIANPAIADISTLSDRTIYVLGKSPGRTSLTLLGADGRLISNVTVKVERDISEFKERLRQILPNEKVEVRTANDGLVLSGTVSSIIRMDRALELAQRYAPGRVSNMMTVGGNHQVMLKVRFAEMQRSVSKSLQSGLVAQNGNGSLSASGRGSIGQGTADGAGLVGNLATSGGFGATLFGFDINALRVDILLEALETKGVVRTLAEPNLTALSGQPASFLAGGEYPVPIASSEGTTTIDYRPFGIELNFTPRVIDGDVINLELKASVSSLDSANGVSSGGVNIDAFSKRETSTTVEMRDGESFAIAGLLQDDFNDSASQIPWIGDIPVLGSLFRSTSYQRDQSELVIIVTPHLVTPTKGEALALPTDRVKIPSERDLFLFGRVAGTTPSKGPAAEVAQQDFSGSYGYILD